MITTKVIAMAESRQSRTIPAVLESDVSPSARRAQAASLGVFVKKRWVVPFGIVADSTAYRLCRDSRPSQSRTPRPSTTGIWMMWR